MQDIINSHVLTESARGISAHRVSDVLFNKRTIFFVEEVNPRSCANLIKDLLYLDTDPEMRPITLFINSAGGDINSGLGVYNVIRSMQCEVNTVCIGIAASMGAILFLAGENRMMYENSTIMIHGPRVILPGQGTMITTEMMSERMDNLNKHSKTLSTIISERTGVAIEIAQQFLQKDTYFDIKEAIAYNIATQIKYRKGAN